MANDTDHIPDSFDGGESSDRTERGIARMIEEAGTICEAMRVAQGLFGERDDDWGIEFHG